VRLKAPAQGLATRNSGRRVLYLFARTNQLNAI
jgi:hypothetical protein